MCHSRIYRDLILPRPQALASSHFPELIYSGLSMPHGFLPCEDFLTPCPFQTQLIPPFLWPQLRIIKANMTFIWFFKKTAVFPLLNEDQENI